MISGSAQHLSYLFDTAIKSGQQEILDWYNYSLEFESKVDSLTADGRIKDKTARSMIYKEMKPFLPTKITQDNLRKKTLRARKHLMLFGKNGVGIDKIKLVSYSATEISKLTYPQIRNVIDQVISKTVPSGNDQNHVISKTNQTTKSEVSVPTAPIPSSHDSNSSGDSSKIGPDNSPVIPYDARAPYNNVALKEYPYLSLYNSDIHNDAYEFKNSGLCPGCGKEHNKGKVVGQCTKGSYYIKCQSSPNEKEIKINTLSEMISSDMSKPTYDQHYFRNKILDQYPNLYREGSSENFDYYGITDETSYPPGPTICPLCKLGHDDDEIEGRYKAGSYFIKCEQREIEITA
jgi:hypothetical protein